MSNTTIVTSDRVTVVHSNPAQPPLAAGAGQAVTASAKNPGQTNAVVHGQVANSTVIIHNPA